MRDAFEHEATLRIGAIGIAGGYGSIFPGP